MECQHKIPVKIEKKNGKVVKISVPCGKCPACLHNKQERWFFRLNETYKAASSAWFITLTYDEANLPYFHRVKNDIGEFEFTYIGRQFELKAIDLLNPDNIAAPYKRELQLFMKRLRKNIYPYKVKYFAVSEYGPLHGRPHYHIILFDFPKEMDIFKQLDKLWMSGTYTCSQVSEYRLRYTAKYTLNSLVYSDDMPKNFLCCSHGIGIEYLDAQNIAFHKRTQSGVIKQNGFTRSIPRYLKEKIFTYDELDEMQEKQAVKAKVAYKAACERLKHLSAEEYERERKNQYEAANEAEKRVIRKAKKSQF